VYAATSPVNGYFGGSLYARMGGKIWIRQMLLSAFMLPALVCGTAFFINFIAIYYHASRAIPFGTMVSCGAVITSSWIGMYSSAPCLQVICSDTYFDYVKPWIITNAIYIVIIV
jgi:hypothetical protein